MPRRTTTPPGPLRRARLAAGLTQQQLAERTGITHPDLSRIERGHRAPWPGFRQRAAEVLGIPEAELFPDAQP